MFEKNVWKWKQTPHNVWKQKRNIWYNPLMDLSILMLLLCEAMDFSIRFTFVGIVHKSQLLAWTTVLVTCAIMNPSPKSIINSTLLDMIGIASEAFQWTNTFFERRQLSCTFVSLMLFEKRTTPCYKGVPRSNLALSHLMSKHAQPLSFFSESKLGRI